MSADGARMSGDRERISPTRRVLLRGALEGGVAVAGLSLESPIAEAATPALLRGARNDAQLLRGLLEYEQVAEFAYAHIARFAVLRARAPSTVARLLGQERRHAQLLASALTARGATVPTPVTGVAAADRTLARLGVSGRLEDAHHQDAALHLLIAVETAGENMYYAAIERLASRSLLDLAGEILACEGQHWSVLSGLLQFENPGRNAPHAFVPLVGQFSR